MQHLGQEDHKVLEFVRISDPAVLFASYSQKISHPWGLLEDSSNISGFSAADGALCARDCIMASWSCCCCWDSCCWIHINHDSMLGAVPAMGVICSTLGSQSSSCWPLQSLLQSVTYTRLAFIRDVGTIPRWAKLYPDRVAMTSTPRDEEDGQETVFDKENNDDGNDEKGEVR